METPNYTEYSRQHDLTAEEVKAFSVFAHLTDEQAEQVIDTLKILTRIVVDYYKKNAEKLKYSEENAYLDENKTL